MKKSIITLFLLAGTTIASQAAIYVVGHVTTTTPATETTEAVEKTDTVKFEMGDRGDGIYSAWINLDENKRLTSFNVLNESLATETSKGLLGAAEGTAIKSTQTVALTGEDAVALDGSIAEDRDLDVFFNPVDSTVTMVSKWNGLYIRGAVNGWGFGDEYKFEYGSGKFVYYFDQGTALMDNLGGESDGFKIANGDWSVSYSLTGDADARTIEFGKATTLTEGDNMYFPTTPYLAEITFDAITKEMTVKEPTLFLRGEMYDWSADVTRAFAPNSHVQGLYELSLAEPTQFNKSFKVGTADWEGHYNFGSFYGQAPVLKLYTGSGTQDIYFSETDGPTADKLYLMTYVAEGALKGNLFLGLPEKLYIVGLGDWNPSEPAKSLDPVEDELGAYEIKGVEPEGTNTDFRIYDGKNSDWGLCSWGFGGEDVANDLEWANDTATAQFTKGFRGKVNIPVGGKYDIKMNIFTGVMTIVNTNHDSVAEVATANVSVSANAGLITVNGTDSMEVYTVGGAHVASGVKTARVASGLYIVRAAGKAFKVIVK